MKKHLVLTILFSLCLFISKAQNISGTVFTNLKKKEKAEYAAVSIEELNKSISTDEKGYFVFYNIPNGKYNITVSMYGYKKATISIVVNGKSKNVTIPLVENPEELQEIEVITDKKTNGSSRLNDVEGTAIYAAKKNELLVLDDITSNKSTNNARQLFSHVSGLNIWESDGAGLQLGIAARGLNPNRTSSFNTRLNGYDLSADAIGYPESYYTPPSESLEEIQVVRGAASLQYGTQFGGMINFITKSGPKDKRLELTTRQTSGSFQFFNSFNSVGGSLGKLNYYAYFQHKQGNGWRINSDFELNSGFASLKYQINHRLVIGVDATVMKYLAHQPGGLTDKDFEEDPLQSKRERNWFQVGWNLGAITVDYDITEKTKLNSRTYALYASRDAVGNLKAINRADDNGKRNLIKDQYQNIGNETRVIQQYKLRNNTSNFLIGIRAYKGFLNRNQGFGTTGSDADFSFIDRKENDGSSYQFPSTNVAVFAENIFQLTNRLSITPGARYEYINTQSSGNYNFIFRNLAGKPIETVEIEVPKRNLTRSFPIFGVGAGYYIDSTIELYTNFSQNYRAITFSDIIVTNPSLVVDSLIEDENGYNFDIGIRGKIKKYFTFDITGFFLSYNDRIGLIQIVNDQFQVKRLRTNIADSRTYGIESFLEIDYVKIFNPDNDSTSLSTFMNLSTLQATYVNSDKPSIQGRKVELVPNSIIKLGTAFRKNNFSASYIFSYTSSQYTDATNAEETSNAVNGLIPAYWVMDLALNYSYKFASLELSVNNLANRIYFTRRADGYPGPGIIPSDGRSIYATLQLKF